MPITSLELLEELERLEDEYGDFPKANDMRRDGNYAATTYYKRFGGNWRTIESVYNTWQETGEEPDECSSVNWHSLNKTLRHNSESSN